MSRDEVFEQIPVQDFTEKAYLDYSMYVILDRALPSIADGLKPVQRRIVYAMSELGLSAGAKHKKAARTVGDVLGKYHPHGDSACYEAMVLMAQPFSYRYPLVDGQGNWGSMDDPRSFAAMRYTEARLTPYAQLLLSELGQGTVDWTANFDGTLQEPVTLPARLPNLLLNGTAGIAVGMATDIPPHNLKEVASACIRLLDDPEADVEALCEHIRGPDYPTGAEIITPREEIVRIYQTGNGSIRQRARTVREQQSLVITALPYQVSGSRVLEQIAAQMRAKKLPMVEDLRDESDHENPTRLVILLRSSRVDMEGLMSHLFATTDLEKSYRVNMNVIGLDGKPRVMNLRQLLLEWLRFRTAAVRRRLSHRLEKVLSRLHVLDGLLVAYLNIDEVIRIIRTEDQPRVVLMKRFSLSEIQADAILDLRLRQLARLEEIRIRREQESLGDERDRLRAILGSDAKLRRLIQDEIAQDAKRYGDDRLSPLLQREPAKAMELADVVSNDPVTVVLSEKGWVRAAKGHDIDPASLTYRMGDAFLAAARGRLHQPFYLFDSCGRSYTLSARDLPSARSQGEPLTGRFNPPAASRFTTVLAGEDEDLCLLASDAGYGFLARLGSLRTKNRAGKGVLSLGSTECGLCPVRVGDPGCHRIAVITAQGRLLLFPAGELPILNRGKGNKLIHIDAQDFLCRGDWVVTVQVLSPAGRLRIWSGKRHFSLRPTDLEQYGGRRGRRGNFLPRGLRNVVRAEVLD